MYVVPPSHSAVSLFNRDGLVRTFSSKAEALRELGYAWIAHNVGSSFRCFSHVQHFLGAFGPEPVYFTYNYILRDAWGEPLTAGDFNALLPRRSRPSWYASRYTLWNGEGPVPGTAKRSGRYPYFRRVQTYGARRDAQFFVEDGEPGPRPRRNPTNIPTNYDDIHRGMSRSWKKHRRTQWKERK